MWKQILSDSFHYRLPSPDKIKRGIPNYSHYDTMPQKSPNQTLNTTLNLEQTTFDDKINTLKSEAEPNPFEKYFLQRPTLTAKGKQYLPSPPKHQKISLTPLKSKPEKHKRMIMPASPYNIENQNVVKLISHLKRPDCTKPLPIFTTVYRKDLSQPEIGQESNPTINTNPTEASFHNKSSSVHVSREPTRPTHIRVKSSAPQRQSPALRIKNFDIPIIAIPSNPKTEYKMRSTLKPNYSNENTIEHNKTPPKTKKQNMSSSIVIERSEKEKIDTRSKSTAKEHYTAKDLSPVQNLPTIPAEESSSLKELLPHLKLEKPLPHVDEKKILQKYLTIEPFKPKTAEPLAASRLLGSAAKERMNQTFNVHNEPNISKFRKMNSTIDPMRKSSSADEMRDMKKNLDRKNSKTINGERRDGNELRDSTNRKVMSNRSLRSSIDVDKRYNEVLGKLNIQKTVDEIQRERKKLIRGPKSVTFEPKKKLKYI